MPFIEHNNKKILFVHIPKTGGSSIEEAMKTLSQLHLRAKSVPVSLKVPPEHFTYSDIKNLFEDNFFDHIFTIVRDPYTKLESEYRMRSLLAQNGFWGSMPKFSIWLEQQLELATNNKLYLANHFRPQSDFLGEGMSVYKYENGLEKSILNMNKILESDIQLPSKKYLSTENYQDEITWDASDIQKVNSFYQKDFSILGYPQKTLTLDFND